MKPQELIELKMHLIFDRDIREVRTVEATAFFDNELIYYIYFKMQNL